MKGIKTLIRLHKLDLDEKRRILSRLEDKRNALEKDIKAGEKTFIEERKMAYQSLEASVTFDAYKKAYKKRMIALAHQLMETSKLVHEAAEKVHAAFQELKKYEIARDQQLEKKHKEVEMTEQKDSDELAMVAHTRRHDLN
jgi:flagellar FliJ protein